MNALWQTARVVTHAARQKRVFWARVWQPAKAVRQDGPAAPAVEISVATAMSTARQIRTWVMPSTSAEGPVSLRRTGS